MSVSASEVAAKPKSLDYLHAAALPHVGLTSWRALVDAANLGKGQTVLIHAAAGGVGSFAVQLAKSRGVKVIGTASSKNLAFLREIGVDEAIDYNATRFEDVVHNVDVVLDTIGGDTQERSWAVLKPAAHALHAQSWMKTAGLGRRPARAVGVIFRTGGILLSLVQPPSEEAATAHGARQQYVLGNGPAGNVLDEIAALVDAGKIKPVITAVHPRADAKTAHDLVESQRTRGKQVLQIVS